ncbi:MAG TPA: hypothetical protein VLL52_10610 [Anaerolineae bacterium]|nr:hypothetical protein [Anaerolineae bacterium]
MKKLGWWLIIGLLLVACGGEEPLPTRMVMAVVPTVVPTATITPSPTATPTVTPAPTSVVKTPTPTATPTPEPTVLLRAAEVSRVEILGEPDEAGMIMVQVEGVLPDVCTEVVRGVPRVEEKILYLTVETEREVAAVCDVIETEYVVTYPFFVGNLEPGTYALAVNGQSVPLILGEEASLGELVTINDMRFTVLAEEPVRVEVWVTGRLPNSCAELGEIRQVQVATDEIQLWIPAVTRDEETDCGGRGPRFEHTFDLDVSYLETGVYTIYANELEGSLTIFL